jgi:hypothetical protein
MEMTEILNKSQAIEIIKNGGKRGREEWEKYKKNLLFVTVLELEFLLTLITDDIIAEECFLYYLSKGGNDYEYLFWRAENPRIKAKAKRLLSIKT